MRLRRHAPSSPALDPALPASDLPPQVRYYTDATLSTCRGALDLRELEKTQLRAPSTYRMDAWGEGREAAERLSFEVVRGERTWVWIADDGASLDPWLAALSQVATAAERRRERQLEAIADDAARAEASVRDSEISIMRRRPSADKESAQAHSVMVSVQSEEGYAPLPLHMRPLGASLHLLRSPKSTLGVVGEVALINGIRTLSFRSSVQLCNETELPVEMTGAARLGANRGMGQVVEPGGLYPLPLALTRGGSDAAVWEVSIRPAHSDALAADTYAAASLLPRESTTAGSMDGLLVCPPNVDAARRGVLPWACCVSVEYETLSSSARKRGAAGPERRPSLGSSGGGDAQQPKAAVVRIQREHMADQLRRLKLPATELISASWDCRIPTPRDSVHGTLYSATSFVCWTAKLKHTHDVVLPWHCVESLKGVGAASDGIELLLTDGTQLVFGSLAQREQAFAELRAAHLQAKAAWSNGVTRWLPRSLKLLPVLVVTNCLPCAFHLRAAAAFMSDADAQRFGWPVLPGQLYGGSGADGGEVAPPTLLPAGETTHMHDPSLLGPIELQVWMCATTEELVAGTRQGSFSLSTPAERRREDELIFSLNPPKLGDKPGATSSTKGFGEEGGGGTRPRESAVERARHAGDECPLRLRAVITQGRAGSLHVHISAINWFSNHSSLPLRLYDAAMLAEPQQVAGAGPHHARKGTPFSNPSGSYSCRVGAVPEEAPGGGPSANQPHESLSKPFSINVAGNEGEVEVGSAAGISELVVHISRTTNAEGAGTAVVELHDRYVLKNRTAHHIEWRHAALGGGGGLLRQASAMVSRARFSAAELAAARVSAVGKGEAKERASHTLPPGGQLAVAWDGGGTVADRLLSVRCVRGWRSYAFCTPFKPAGGRRDHHQAAAGGGRDGAERRGGQVGSGPHPLPPAHHHYDRLAALHRDPLGPRPRGQAAAAVPGHEPLAAAGGLLPGGLRGTRGELGPARRRRELRVHLGHAGPRRRGEPRPARRPRARRLGRLGRRDLRRRVLARKARDEAGAAAARARRARRAAHCRPGAARVEPPPRPRGRGGRRACRGRCGAVRRGEAARQGRSQFRRARAAHSGLRALVRRLHLGERLALRHQLGDHLPALLGDPGGTRAGGGGGDGGAGTG